jgi:hypothetical protein
VSGADQLVVELSGAFQSFAAGVVVGELDKLVFG